MPCGKIASIIGSTNAARYYPECATASNGNAIVRAAIESSSRETEQVAIGAVVVLSTPLSQMLALAVHAIGVELYLHLTPAEHERLRQMSYKRQLQAGMENPGSAGWTSDRLGDAKPWRPDTSRFAAE
jgi:hypothetical protein